MKAPEDAEGLLAWRIERLREQVSRHPLANLVARDTGYDLHQLLGLIDHPPR